MPGEPTAAGGPRPSPGAVTPRGFEPWGASTGIGSLPHTDLDAALRLVAATCPEVPYWPQLPRAVPAEAPLRTALGPLDGVVEVQDGVLVSLVGEEALLDRLAQPDAGMAAVPQGVPAFVDAVIAGRFPRCRAVKGQIYGPLTLAGLLRVGNVPALQLPELVAALARSLAAQAAAQATMLAACGVPVLVLVDEPGLAAARHLAVPPEVLDTIDIVVDGARAAGALAGLHLCGGAARHPAAGRAAAVTSVDVTGPTVADAAALRRSGLVGWGVVGADGGTADVRRAVGGLLELGGGPPGHGTTGTNGTTDDAGMAGLRRSLFTPSCGLGLVDPVRAAGVAHAVHGLSGYVRRLVLDGLAATYLATGPSRSPA